MALHLRDSREVLQILISDSVTGSPAQVVQADTPPDRIRIERFGKASIVLARCGALDQSVYEPIFRDRGSAILEKYRARHGSADRGSRLNWLACRAPGNPKPPARIINIGRLFTIFLQVAVRAKARRRVANERERWQKKFAT